MYTSRTKSRIKILCLMNDCNYYQTYLFTGSELYSRYDKRVMDLNTYRNLFQIRHFVRTYNHNLKTPGCICMFYILHDCFTIGDVFFCVKAGCEIQLASYGSNHILHSISDKQFACITWTLQVTYGHSAYWTTTLLSETFLVCVRVAWEIRLETCGTKHIAVVVWYKIVYILQACIFVTMLCNYTWQQNLGTLCLHAIYQMMALLSTMYRFIGALLTSYTARCSVISINRIH